MISFIYFFIMIEIVTQFCYLYICLYPHALIQHCSFCTVFILGETDQLSAYLHIIMLSFLCHCTLCRYIYDCHTFLLQEELYSYCNRVKRSILEVSYIVLYRSYPDRQRRFISTREENEWITGKKDEIDCSKEQS